MGGKHPNFGPVLRSWDRCTVSFAHCLHWCQKDSVPPSDFCFQCRVLCGLRSRLDHVILATTNRLLTCQVSICCPHWKPHPPVEDSHVFEELEGDSSSLLAVHASPGRPLDHVDIIADPDIVLVDDHEVPDMEDEALEEALSSSSCSTPRRATGTPP